MKLIPMERKEAAEFVKRLHHDPVLRDRFRIGAEHNGVVCGVVQVGNPVVRALSAAARVARDLGYSKIITYILDTENGASLRAAGWHKEADIRGKSWNTPSRPRRTTAPTQDKQRWAREL